MGEWKEYQLDELASVTGGKRLPLGTFLTDMPTSHPYIRTRDLAGNKVDANALQFVPDDVFPHIKQYIVTAGDIIVSVVGTIGLCAMIPEKLHNASLTENCNRISGFKTSLVSPEYLFFYLTGSVGQDELRQRTVGSTQPKLPMYNLREMPIPLPPVDEQRAIASVLSSLDAKIDLLHRQNKTLEAMAEALFRQWFLEGDGTQVPVTDIIDFNPSLPLKKSASAPYLEMKNLQETSSIPDGIRYREFTSGMRFQNGDTLLARISPCLENGKCCYVQCMKEGEVGWGSTEFIVMRSKKGYSPFLTYALAKSSDFIDFAANTLAGSSGRQRAQLNIVMEFQLVKPDANTVTTLNAQFDGFAKRIDLNHRQIQSLTALRDTLLPKLMSGEVRVDAEYLISK
jgi:type I restriction enzyme S subunit